jgi:hypothetical protein
VSALTEHGDRPGTTSTTTTSATAAWVIIATFRRRESTTTSVGPKLVPAVNATNR